MRGVHFDGVQASALGLEPLQGGCDGPVTGRHQAQDGTVRQAAAQAVSPNAEAR
ncbi:hypothetical protein [Streptomyces sp. NBC_00500]|uniref:hypothetical protein n=1 Tax=Streptomyces sp. NBC_00500 TaxID=2975762 RepID=UPI0030E092D8